MAISIIKTFTRKTLAVSVASATLLSAAAPLAATAQAQPTLTAMTVQIGDGLSSGVVNPLPLVTVKSNRNWGPGPEYGDGYGDDYGDEGYGPGGGDGYGDDGYGQDFGRKMCVAVPRWDVLNVRRGPGRKYPIKGFLRGGKCTVVMTNKCVRRWCKIKSRRVAGWVNVRFLRPGRGYGN